MKEDFVTFKQAAILKELGFDWPCNYWYHPQEPNKVNKCQSEYNHNGFGKPYSAPTLSYAQKWLREVKGVSPIANVSIHKSKYMYSWSVTIFKEGRGEWDDDLVYDTFEQALSAGIDRALEILKQ